MEHNHDDTPCQRVQHMTLSESLSLAPAAISLSTTSEWPLEDAMKRGVAPSCNERWAMGTNGGWQDQNH